MNKNNILKYLKSNFIYNKNSGTLFWNRSFPGVPNGKEAGCSKNTRYKSIRICGKLYKAHRLIWLLENGNWPTNEIDHINGNRFDNRIINLRDVTCRKNGCNKENHRKGKLPGASFNKGKWNSMMWINKSVYLGRFKTEEEAHLRYLFELESIGEL